jgi:choline transport protein
MPPDMFKRSTESKLKLLPLYLRKNHAARVGVSTDLPALNSFSLLTLAGVGIVLGSTWGPAGSSIVVALFNGGPPGVLYEFIVVSVFYWIVAASIAELASAIPSSGGVYHWASVTPGKNYGRVVGFFAGYWNWLAWVLGAASISSIAGES